MRHTHNFLFVPLQDGELVLWSAGTSAVQHFLFHRGQVHFWLGERVGGMRNDGSVSFRAVIVEFLNPKVTSYGYQYQSGTWDYGSGAINAPVDPDAKFIDEMTVGAASVADVQLLTADTYPPPKKEADELLIAVTELDLKANDEISDSQSFLAISCGFPPDAPGPSQTSLAGLRALLWWPCGRLAIRGIAAPRSTAELALKYAWALRRASGTFALMFPLEHIVSTRMS